MKKFLIVLAIVLIAGGAYAYSTKDSSPTFATATFTCDDENNPHGFTATFPDAMDEVTISSEGEDNVIPAVASTSGKVFENDMWSFVFKGETATITDKKTKTSVTCTQPLVKDMAPMNFGD